LGHFQKAIEYYTESLAIANEMGDREWQALTYANLGSAYNSLEQLDKALANYNMGLAIALEIGNRHTQCFLYSNLHKLHTKLGNTAKAAEFEHKHRELAIQLPK
jgi:tetratricopeptide (TPR) repeat protein